MWDNLWSNLDNVGILVEIDIGQALFIAFLRVIGSVIEAFKLSNYPSPTMNNVEPFIRFETMSFVCSVMLMFGNCNSHCFEKTSGNLKSVTSGNLKSVTLGNLKPVTL